MNDVDNGLATMQESIRVLRLYSRMLGMSEVFSVESLKDILHLAELVTAEIALTSAERSRLKTYQRIVVTAQN